MGRDAFLELNHVKEENTSIMYLIENIMLTAISEQSMHLTHMCIHEGLVDICEARITLRWILNSMGGCSLSSFGSEHGSVVGSLDCGNGHSDCIKCSEFYIHSVTKKCAPLKMFNYK